MRERGEPMRRGGGGSDLGRRLAGQNGGGNPKVEDERDAGERIMVSGGRRLSRKVGTCGGRGMEIIKI